MGKPPLTEAELRTERRAAALRANLRRRKAGAAARRPAPEPPGPAEKDADSQG